MSIQTRSSGRSPRKTANNRSEVQDRSDFYYTWEQRSRLCGYFLDLGMNLIPQLDWVKFRFLLR